MFKELGQLAGLMKNLPKIQASMAEFQQKTASLQAEASVGGDLVTVRVNGKMEILACTISPEALADREMLEELIRSATNQALAKVRELLAAETAKMAQDLGLPPGMNLPGLG